MTIQVSADELRRLRVPGLAAPLELAFTSRGVLLASNAPPGTPIGALQELAQKAWEGVVGSETRHPDCRRLWV